MSVVLSRAVPRNAVATNTMPSSAVPTSLASKGAGARQRSV
jgi:hypothetical protein